MDNKYILAIVIISVITIFLFLNTRFVSERIHYFFSRVLFNSFPFNLVSNKTFQMIVSGITGAYFVTLDVWGNTWGLIKDYISIHENIFVILLIISLSSLFLRGVSDWVSDKNKSKYVLFLEKFVLLSTSLVEKKTYRFKSQFRSMKPTSDTFKQLTQPKDQINIILAEIERLLLDVFGLKKNEVCITIIRKDPANGQWYYDFETNKGWAHTKPNKLLAGKSAASKCLELGEPVFYACKKTAGKNKESYYISERDSRTGDGSVFCYPCKVFNSGYEDTYIISFVTYGKRLCGANDVEQQAAIREIFSSICRRLDLELTLYSIKYWKYKRSKEKPLETF